MSQLHTLRELNLNAENLAEEWRRWEKSLRHIMLLLSSPQRQLSRR